MPTVRNLRPILLTLAVAVVVGLLAWRHFTRAVPIPLAVRGTPVATPLTGALADVGQRADSTKAGSIPICGYPNAPIDRHDPDSINHYVGEVSRTATARSLSALKDSGDLRARVAGLLLEGRLGDDVKRASSEQTSESVVQLAAGSADPAVYAMAVLVCGTYSGTGTDTACRQITVQRWAQLDPGNAVPWLLLADQDGVAHDTTAADDAFSRAANAHEIESYGQSLYAFAAPELPTDLSPLERAYLATEVIGVEAAMPLPHFRILDQRCSSDALKDGALRQQCDAFAELLLGRGTTLLDRYLGRILGARAGWRSERVNALLDEQNAMYQALRDEQPSGDDFFWTCDGLNRVNAFLAQRVKLGEVAAARAALEGSGESVPAMAQKYREYMEGLRRNALAPVDTNAAPP